MAEQELVDAKWREVLADGHRFEWTVAAPYVATIVVVIVERVVVCPAHNDWHSVGQVSDLWPERTDTGIEIETDEACQVCARRAPKRILAEVTR